MTQSDDHFSRLKGRHILIVEDEAIVAMLLENILEDIGCTPVGPALTLEQAHATIAAAARIDAAILDVNLRGERVYPLADALAARGVPIVFATGYGEGGLDSAWRGRPTIQKPYTIDDIIRVLNEVVGDRSSLTE